MVLKKGTVLLATMSEAGTIDAVLQEIAESCHNLKRFQWELDVLIVEDGNDPDFELLCQNLGSNYGLSVRVMRGSSAGLGAAILIGFRAALDNPLTEFVINLDADGQHDGRQIGDLLRAHITANADITIGSRWTKGGRCYGLSHTRKFISRVSGTCLHFAGVPRHVKDPTTSFRIYGRKVLETISRDLIGFTGFSFFGASIAIADAANFKIIETPIHFRPRLSGNSNLKLSQIKFAVRDLPAISSISHMVRNRRINFLEQQHGNAGPADYNARRELEQLSHTPVSTRIIVEELSPYLGNHVLEIGAGMGQISTHLISQQRNLTSLEPDANLFISLETRTKGTQVARFNETLASALDSGAISSHQRFESILYVNVLEHIEQDTAELNLAKQFLTVDGRIVIFVPALPSLYGTMDAVSGHFRRYRRSEFQALAKQTGLKVEKLYYFDALGIIPYWLSYRVLSRKTLGGGTVVLYDKVIIPLSSLLSKILGRRGPGKNLIAVLSVGSD